MSGLGLGLGFRVRVRVRFRFRFRCHRENVRRACRRRAHVSRALVLDPGKRLP